MVHHAVIKQDNVPNYLPLIFAESAVYVQGQTKHGGSQSMDISKFAHGRKHSGLADTN